MLRNPHVPDQDVHAHQHGMAGLESTAAERVSVANPALSLTTLYLCNMGNPMADHTRLDNIGPNVPIHSRRSLTVLHQAARARRHSMASLGIHAAERAAMAHHV